MEVSNLFVCLMGLGTVFACLVSIIFICWLMSLFFRKTVKDKPAKPADSSSNLEPISNRQEMIAAISAAVAEELGKDVSAIRILSVKKI